MLDEDDWFDLEDERVVIPSRGINATQAGQFIGVPPSTIRTWLQRGVIPPKARTKWGRIDGLELWAWWSASSLRTQRSRETLSASSACP